MSEVSIEAPGHAQQMASAPVPAAGHVFRWLATGSATFETILQHIERAEHSVALEFYICKPGVVSDRFRIALIAASLRGVRVQVLLDAFGSDAVAGGYWRELERCGGQLRWFNPMRLLLIAIGLTVAMWLFLLHTRIGRGIRAAAQNLVAARLYGVNPKRIYALTFGLGAALAGVAGGLYGTVSQINPYIGGPLTAKSFAIAIIGGLDNPLGVIVGGLCLGIIESLTALYIGPTYRDVASFGILVLILIVRPSGILGRTT